MNRATRRLFATLTGSLALLAAVPAQAAPAVGCEGFLWPLAEEIAQIKASDSVAVESGATLPAPPSGKAVAITLKPAPEVKLPATPTSTPKPDDDKKFAGAVNFSRIEKGHYQVTMSGPGWIDVVQNGRPLEATGHTGSADCEFIRKSVRFEVEDGAIAVQVHGVPKASLKITIRPAAD